MKTTEYLAIYAALLSTTVFIWNAARSKPKIKVRVTFAIETVDDETRHGIGISVQNPSSHDAHITSVSFLYPFRSVTLRERLKHMAEFKRIPVRTGWCHSRLSLNEIEDGCPVTIKPGKSHWIFVPDESLAEAMDSATASYFKVAVQDALWRNKYSRKFDYTFQKKQKPEEKQQ